MITLVVFAAAAIFLAVLGVYGVLFQRVRQRSREIGIRMVMGADTLSVVGWVAMAGVRLIGIGLVVGLFATQVLAGSLRSLLFGVTPTDAVTLMAVIASLAAVGLLAMLIPSWRATRIDPAAIMRQGQ